MGYPRYYILTGGVGDVDSMENYLRFTWGNYEEGDVRVAVFNGEYGTDSDVAEWGQWCGATFYGDFRYYKGGEQESHLDEESNL